MKKFTFLLLALFTTMSLSIAQSLPLDFEGGSNYNITNFGGGILTTILNPQSSGINTSDSVGQMVKNDGEVYGGSYITLDAPIDFTGLNTFTMKVYSPRTDARVILKVENLTNPGISFEQEVKTKVADQWEELSFNYSAINKDNDYQKVTVIFDNGVKGDGSSNFTFLIDDIALSFVEIPTEPDAAAPAPPVRDAADVISIFSEAYTNVSGTNLNPGWGQTTTVTIEKIAGDSTLKYANFNFQGTQFGSTQNASEMEFLHVDMWTSDATVVKVTPISISTGEKLVTLTPIESGSWNSYDIPVTEFTDGGMSFSDLHQLKFDGQSGTTPSTIFLDNIYFYKTPVTPDSDASLSDLKVDGTTIDGFSPSILDYYVGLVEGTAEVPTVTVTETQASASSVITEATVIPDTTKIVVTAPNGTTTKTYQVIFTISSPATGPTAPPARNAANVISLFSNAYTNETVDSWSAVWDDSEVEDVQIGGDDVKKYTFKNFAGIDFSNHKLYTSEMTHFHMDIWTPDEVLDKALTIKNVDFGGGSAEASNFILTVVHTTNGDIPALEKGSWVSIDVPITAFAGDTSRSDLAQMVISTNLKTVYIDNIYFYNIPTARVQVIHNSADLAADTVDVYLNDGLLLDNFAFRNASQFVDAPAGVEFDISIAPKTSADSSEAIWRESYTLADGETYILVANGIVSGSGYSPATPFTIDVMDMGRESASTAGNSDVLVYHGSTDAPTVDVYEPYAGARLVDDISYGEFQGYLELATADYSLQVQTADGRSAVAQYAAPLETLSLQDEAMVVVASGFLNPGENSNGASFGLYVALPSGGELVALPSEDIASARVQVIHNSADAAASEVDVWYNDTPLLPGFKFRTASAFVDVTAGTEFDISIQGSGSSDTTNAIWKKSYTLTGDMTYILVANGIVSGSGYDPAEAFDIYVYGMGQETAEMAGKTDVLVFHGATDAPSVDVFEPYAGLRVVDDMAYGDFKGYLALDNADYSLQIQTADGRTAVAQYAAPLETLGLADSALVVVASGFLTPDKNSSGPAFGLFAALPQGGDLVELPSEDIASARVQVIHNSADAAASEVDVWYNDTPLLPGFKFRTASAFIDVTAGTEFDISIQGSGSSDTTNAIWKKSYTLTGDMTYVLVANGIVSASGYDPVKAFDIYVSAMGREMASTSGNTDVYVFHGSTDAPTVDIHEATAGELINNLEYGMFDADYLELPTADYVIEVRDETGATVVASYQAPLATLNLSDSALVAVASGFLNPANNSDGPAFGIWVALPMGGDLIELPAVPTSVNDISNESIVNVQVYPNPVSTALNVNFTLKEASDIQMEIIGITGKTMLSREFGMRNAGSHLEMLNLESLENGIYMLKLNTGNSIHTARIKVMK